MRDTRGRFAPEELRRYEVTERLRDGRPVRLRAVRPGDKQALRAEFGRMSAQSRYLRYFGPKRALATSELTALTEVDFVHHVALVALVEEEGEERLVADGRAVAAGPGDPPRRAEVVFAVDDAHQRLGVATLLLRHLVRIGRRMSVETFEAVVLPGNRRMLDVFEHSGLPQRRRRRDGVLEVELSLGASF